MVNVEAAEVVAAGEQGGEDAPEKEEPTTTTTTKTKKVLPARVLTTKTTDTGASQPLGGGYRLEGAWGRGGSAADEGLVTVAATERRDALDRRRESDDPVILPGDQGAGWRIRAEVVPTSRRTTTALPPGEEDEP